MLSKCVSVDPASALAPTASDDRPESIMDKAEEDEGISDAVKSVVSAFEARVAGTLARCAF